MERRGLPQDDEADADFRGRASRNPGSDSPAVRVKMPESVEVRLVDASTLLEYEIWTGLGTACLSATIGFLVAWSEAGDRTGGLYAASCGVSGGVVLVSVGMAIWKRTSIRQATKTVDYAAADVETGQG